MNGVKKTLIKLLLIFIYIDLVKTGENSINFKLHEMDSVPIDLLWCGKHNEITLMLTVNNGLYRTEDKGLHWKKINDLLTNLGKEELEKNQNKVGLVSKMVRSKADPTLIILLGTEGINWVAEECGAKIRALNNGRKINEYKPHPTERSWGLASAFTICDDFVNEPCKLYKEVFITKDLGKQWKQIGKYVVQFGWGIVNEKQMTKGVPKERILMSYEPRGEGNQNMGKWNYKVDFVCSDDFFKTKKLLVSKGNKFYLTEHFLFVVAVSDQSKQEVILYSSKSNHPQYDFQLIETSQKSFIEKSYTFLDATYYGVFLQINHFGEKSSYGHVYTSGATGLKYSLSLRNILRGRNGHCDFEKVNSVEGVYVANVISPKYMKLAKKELQLEVEKNINSLKVEDNKKKTYSSHHKSNLAYTDYIKSQITFNQGGKWQRIRAPLRDSQGTEYSCGNYCYLNLFGLSSNFAPFYSVDTAAGIIIGNGNVGRYLSKEINTFMSRDGGLTWFEVKKGSHIYEIGDEGGLILLAKDLEPTDYISYSYDEGLSWEDIKISEEKFFVQNIIVEPTSTSHHFIIYGASPKNGTQEGITIALDFGSHFPPCKNPDKPGTDKSDYEIWSPSDGRAGKNCLLGHTIEIIRKKRTSKCINTENFVRKVEKTNCPCTEMDYQCDVGYERQEEGGPCIKIDYNLGEEIIKPPLICKKTYKISKGYRKIPGNTCVNGLKYDPIKMPCPNNGITSGHSIIIFVIVVIFIVTVGYILLQKGAMITFEFDISGIKNIFNKVNESMNKPEQYGKVTDFEDDNTLFEDDNKILTPDISIKKKKDNKNENTNNLDQNNSETTILKNPEENKKEQDNLLNLKEEENKDLLNINDNVNKENKENKKEDDEFIDVVDKSK